VCGRGPYGVSKSGIYFMSHENGKTTIELYDTRTQKIRPIFSLEKSPPYWIGDP
jgi:hypothetical protein